MAPLQLKVVKLADNSLATSNLYYIHSDHAKALGLPESARPFHLLLNNVIPIPASIASQTSEVGCLHTSGLQRKSCGLNLGDTVTVVPWNPDSRSNLVSATVEVEITPPPRTQASYEANELNKLFLDALTNFVVHTQHLYLFKDRDRYLQVRVLSLTGLGVGANPSSVPYGCVLPRTSLIFQPAFSNNVLIENQRKSIINPDFKFEDLGIGGLDEEFADIFRRAFASRVFPQRLIDAMGIKHVKGIILFGPPGTGKTLTARQIGKMLNAREPKIVSGPEILSKYVGQSEENIRNLFADAQKEYDAKKDNSSLHIIILDELDAICKQRGGRSDNTGVGDSVVNQLLANIDGVKELNNVLLIGMTNRLDMIDEALLRPGRFEVHVEVGLPDEAGRLQILKIHTAAMSKNGIMEKDVELAKLAAETKNYSGAELAGLIKSASSFAFSRHMKLGDKLSDANKNVEGIHVTSDDFRNALNEVKPAFGVSEKEIAKCLSNGIIPFSRDVDRILQEGEMLVHQVTASKQIPLVTALLYGPPGSGKTALAAEFARRSRFPYIKVVSAETMVGLSEQAKISAIQKVFQDAYRSKISAIIIDSIERLLDWVRVGPRFSNGVLQALIVLMKTVPPKERKLLILATTSQLDMVRQMEMEEVFDPLIPVLAISDAAAVMAVIEMGQETSIFTTQERNRIQELLQESSGFEIGVKRLLALIDRVKLESTAESDRVEKFVGSLISQPAKASSSSSHGF